MKKMKKLTALLLSVLIMMTSLGVMAADEESIEIDVDISEFVGNWDTLKSGYRTVRFDIPETGVYAIIVDISNASSLEQSRDFYADTAERTKIMTVTVSCSELDRNGYGPWYNNTVLATWEFSEGENIIYMVNGDRFRMRNLKLKKLNKATLESAEIGGISYSEDTAYARGTDNISLIFNEDIDSESLNNIAIETSGGESIDAVASLDTNDSKKVIISLKDSLGYDKAYILTASGIKDSIGYTLDDVSLTFSTLDESAEDSGSDTASIDSFVIKDDIATVKGTVVGSTGVGISGRKVDLYLTFPEKSEILAASTVSEKDGKYELTYEITDVDTAGNVVAEVDAEYASERASDTYYYVVDDDSTEEDDSTENVEITVDVDLSEFVGNWDTLKSGYKTVRFDIPETGVYAIIADISNASSPEQSRDFYADTAEKTKIMTVTVSCPELDRNGYGPWYNNTVLATWEFSEGENIIYMVNGDRFRMRNLKLKKLNKATLESAEIGGISYSEDTAYARGTDNISLIFNGDIDSESLNNIAIETSGGESIDAVASLDTNDSKKVIISLKDSLDYSETYSLTARGIKDIYKFTLDDVELVFSTLDESAEDSGSATASIDSFEIKDDIATVKGTVVGSTGVGISGRKVDLYLTFPEKREILAASTVSKEDGKYELTYEITDVDTAGNVVAEVEAEYSSERASKTCFYVSADILASVLGELSGADTSESVESVLSDNEEYLDIDLVGDLRNAGINIHSEFYDMFVGESENLETIDEFRELYGFAIAMQRINEATDSNGIKAVIENQDNATALGIEAARLNALNTDGRETLYQEICNFVKLFSKGDFKDSFDVAFNAALLTHAGLTDITLTSLSSVTARQGAELSLDIKSANLYSGVKEFILDFSFDGVLKNAVSDIEFTGEKATCSTTISSDGANVTITITAPDTTKQEIGKLSFTSSAVGSGTVKVSGMATASTGTDYDASLAVEDMTYSVVINAQKTDKIGGGSGGFGGGSSGGGGFVSGSTVIPTVTAPVETSASQKVFSDLSDTPWAEEAILGLYNHQAITASEDKLFYPNRPISRAEFIKMVVLAKDMYLSSLTEIDFADVSESDWYYQYVLAAVNFNIIKGDDNGCFRPNDYITREDICVILARIGITGVDIEATPLFGDDALISDYAKESVYVMKEAGIVNGMGGNLFAPKANATRAEAAKIIYGMMQ